MSRNHLDPETRRWLRQIGAKGGAAGTRENKVKASRAAAQKRAMTAKGLAARVGLETSIPQAAREHGLHPRTLRWRLEQGWTLERALGVQETDL